MSARFELDREPLSLWDVVSIARDGAKVELGDGARAQVEEAHRALVAATAEGAAIYGATTGVGTRDSERIDPARSERFQKNLIRSHAMGVGEPATAESIRAMMAVRVSQLAMGRSGISLATLEAFVAMLDRGVTPHVPSLGSVGASDLAPLAHAALPLIGEGRAVFEGAMLPGAEALRAAGIEAPPLRGRDALAWIAGPALTVGGACLAIADARAILDAVERGAALTMHALGSHKGAFDPELMGLKPHPGAVTSAARLWELLPEAGTTAREPLAIRCLPYVVGAGREALEALEEVAAIELAAPTDNPIWRRDLGFFGGGATFDTHRLARALDLLSDALLPIASAAEQRIARLCDPSRSDGLPAFVIGATDGATESSGMMIAQYTATSLVARMRARISAAGPGTTCNGFEDSVSLAPLSVERLREALSATVRIVAIEQVVAAQAIDLRGRRPRGVLGDAYEGVRRVSPFMDDDRSLGEELEGLAETLRRAPSAEGRVAVSESLRLQLGDAAVVSALGRDEALEAERAERVGVTGIVRDPSERLREKPSVLRAGRRAGDHRQARGGVGPGQDVEAFELPGGDVAKEG